MANTFIRTLGPGSFRVWKFRSTSYVDPETVTIGSAPFIGAFASYTGGFGTVPIVPLYSVSNGTVSFNGGTAGVGVDMVVITG